MKHKEREKEESRRWISSGVILKSDLKCKNVNNS